jgi:hypothetical protein
MAVGRRLEARAAESHLERETGLLGRARLALGTVLPEERLVAARWTGEALAVVAQPKPASSTKWQTTAGRLWTG